MRSEMDSPSCLYCGAALRRNAATNFCRVQHGAMFADALVRLGFPRPHRPTQWCKQSNGCAHLPLMGHADAN